MPHRQLGTVMKAAADSAHKYRRSEDERANARRSLIAAVLLAHDLGASYADIAEVVGMSKQNVGKMVARNRP